MQIQRHVTVRAPEWHTRRWKEGLEEGEGEGEGRWQRRRMKCILLLM